MPQCVPFIVFYPVSSLSGSSLAAAKDISMEATVAAVLSELCEKQRMALKACLVGIRFFFFFLQQEVLTC